MNVKNVVKAFSHKEKLIKHHKNSTVGSSLMNVMNVKASLKCQISLDINESTW